MKKEFSAEEKESISKLVDAYYEDVEGKISKERLKELVEETYLEVHDPISAMLLMNLKINEEMK